MRKTALAPLGAALLLALAGCGSSAGAQQADPSSAISTAPAPSPSDSMSMHPSPAKSASVQPSSGASRTASFRITIKGFAFHSSGTAKPGETVKVTNHDKTTHSFTSDKGLWSKIVKPGTTVTIKAPSKQGAYHFHCMFHANMHGVLKVS